MSGAEKHSKSTTQMCVTSLGEVVIALKLRRTDFLIVNSQSSVYPNQYQQ